MSTNLRVEELQPDPIFELNPNKDTDNISSASVGGIVGGVIAAVVAIIVVIVIIIFVMRKKKKGSAYQTQEANGAREQHNPDHAVKYGRTGQPDIKDEVYI